MRPCVCAVEGPEIDSTAANSIDFLSKALDKTRYPFPEFFEKVGKMHTYAKYTNMQKPYTHISSA